MTTQYAAYHRQLAARNRRSWSLIAALLVLFLGPLIAPLFQVTGLPFVADSGTLAHDLLARYICPTPAKSYSLLGFPMAVCARCWGATIGLWAAWLMFKSQVASRRSQAPENPYQAFSSWLFRRPWALKLSLAVGALLLWTLEIDAWPAAPLPVLLINGASGGLWAGLCISSIWPALRQ
jgi:hypothetical protein